uniref:DNA 3'-5' helicase n=1 Tax=Candidatus Kentrum sp. FW TaxID=2126338 RepID=A0A450U0C1_9GAMM|nr:MAG: ATP-dependent exoDNAse (exonuclease V) beta subunit (contains helicase and exonuclease domains) [Candidatus Kentron sp. FW]
MSPADQPIRDLALDPTRSFIVQAPAGSGKTGLIIQRYLTLLALVENPEEVIAVTFTRKAVGEMQERILMALDNARGAPPASPFERRTRELARKVSDRDIQQGWNLRVYPARLRIRTIDALCASIIRQAPWRSGFGAEPNTLENAEPLYRQAAHDLLERLETDQGPKADALACVLQSLDNDLIRFEATLIRMLARRDQWLRHLTKRTDSASRRQQMTRALTRIIEEALTVLRTSVPPALSEEIIAIAAYAGANLARLDPSSPIAALAELRSLPGNTIEDTVLWRGIAALLLTRTGEWRARYTQKEGFPPAKDLPAHEKESARALKKRAEELKNNLSDAQSFRVRLHGVRELPTPGYDDGQWAVLDALMTVLGLATETLETVFSEHGTVDFIQVSQGALAALAQDGTGDPTFPLDHRVSHLLVDEFQDTSHAQVLLLTRLTADWRTGDGRTLFLVGDPMQSIYRFREADVGLYLHARKHGIGNIPLEALTLSVNFRAREQLVEWANKTFPQVFPGADDADTGTVRFTPSVAHKKASPHSGVGIHAYRKDRMEQEADQVVTLIQAAKREHPSESVAVLARTRTHLSVIVPRLRAARIPYRGVEIAPLVHKPMIQDLLALTRALLHPGDRIAWLSVLRAPWCGLTLDDLHALAGNDRGVCVLEQLRAWHNAPTTDREEGPGSGKSDFGRQPSLDGRLRAGRVFRVIDAALRERARKSLRTMVEGVWIALGGPACIDTIDTPDTQAFFGLLEKLEAEAGVPDGHQVTEAVSRLYAAPNLTDWHVEIMTIHKAKGLEFDTVILPGLARVVRPSEKPLLAWVARPTASNDFDLVLAPMTTPGDPDDPVYRYLCLLDAAKTDHEAARLLYVAITRARRRVHLLGGLQRSEKNGEISAPDRRSLLAHLWPAVSSEFTASLVDNDSNQTHDSLPHPVPSTARESMFLERLSANWRLPEPPTPLKWFVDYPQAPIAIPEAIEFSWAGNTARNVGILIHRILRYLAENRTSKWPNTQGERVFWRAALRGLGVSGDELETALDKVIRAIMRVTRDPRWHWILDASHLSPRNEYRLTGIVHGQLINGIIDRTFVDIHGTRWIIDYKTGTHAGGELAEFLDREQTRYRDQLARYADLLKGMESRPIRAGLYFPLITGGWRAWEIDSELASGPVPESASKRSDDEDRSC